MSKSVSRRDLFRRLFARGGPEAARTAETRDLARAYVETLQREAESLPWGLPVSILPGEAEAIENALLEVGSREGSPQARSFLSDAYGWLSCFVGEKDLQVLRAGRRAFETDPNDPDSRNVLVEAFALRSTILGESAKRRKRFDGEIERRAVVVRLAAPVDAKPLTMIELDRRRLADPRREADEDSPEARPSLETVGEEVRAWLGQLKESVFVLTTAGRIAGFCRVARLESGKAMETPSAEIVTVVVDLLERRRGRGRRLLEGVFDALATEGFVSVMARVSHGNDDAESFLRALGFAPEAAVEAEHAALATWRRTLERPPA